jgi:glycosyltransferase involved in cell wall biosynthesis
VPPNSPSFDLIVATKERVAELATFLDSVEAQSYDGIRVLVVDQNGDDRLASVLAGRGLEVVHLRSEPGLSRARNAALEHLRADLVAFPDDDCAYPPGLLERVAHQLRVDPTLDGLSGRSVGPDGSASASWKEDPAVLTDDNLWNRVNSAAVFLRRPVLDRVGPFDERLGLGSGEPHSSGEEIDYVIRALRGGSRLAYDPSLTIVHDVAEPDGDLRYRDGASVGYILRKHRYPRRVVLRMLVRPLGGAALSLLRLDPGRARLHLATLRGRLAGYRVSSSKSTA